MIYITVCAIVGAGVVTGLLFAFSNFVMQSLAKLPNDQGMFAMQQINEKIINPIFLTFFLGTPLLCLLIGAKASMDLEANRSIFLLAGAVLYLIGPFGITVLFNVPLNDRLAKTDRAESDTVWPEYQLRWQRWNHARTYIGVVSIAFLSLGLAGG